MLVRGWKSKKREEIIEIWCIRTAIASSITRAHINLTKPFLDSAIRWNPWQLVLMANLYSKLFSMRQQLRCELSELELVSNSAGWWVSVSTIFFFWSRSNNYTCTSGNICFSFCIIRMKNQYYTLVLSTAIKLFHLLAVNVDAQ